MQMSKPHICGALQNVLSTQGLFLSRQIRRPPCCGSAGSHRFLTAETRMCFQSSPGGVLVNRVVLGQNFSPILGTFAKLQKKKKATVRVVMCVCPSVCMEQLRSHWTDLYENWYLIIFRNSFEIRQVSLRSSKNNGYWIWRPIHIFDHTIVHFFF